MSLPSINVGGTLQTLRDLGCVSGECDGNGGSGECCGKMYYSAVIYPDGDFCEWCGNARHHGSRLAKNEVHVDAFPAIWWDTSRGLVKLSKDVSYRPAKQAFVLNKCSHSYAVLIERDYPGLMACLHADRSLLLEPTS